MRADFESTALPHLDQLYSTASYLTRDPERAADLVQDTLVRAIRFWHRFEPGTNCRAWLLTILYNSFRNQYRSDKSSGTAIEYDDGVAGTPGAATDDPADLVAAAGLDDELEAALASLSDEFREVVVLVDLQELTYEEAASVLGRPIGTVRSRLARARQQLHTRLAEYGRQRGWVR